jgi:hypothetical protein
VNGWAPSLTGSPQKFREIIEGKLRGSTLYFASNKCTRQQIKFEEIFVSGRPVFSNK